MSPPSPLNTLLATRLDAVLGTTLAQHPTLLDVRASQAAQAMSALHPQDNVIRRAPDPAADAAARGTRRAGTELGAQDRAAAPPSRAEMPVSARAFLSEPAKAILALLVARPDVPPAVRGAVPMLRLAAASVHMTAPGALGTRAPVSGESPAAGAGPAAGTPAAASPPPTRPAGAGAQVVARGGASPATATTAAPNAAPNAASTSARPLSVTDGASPPETMPARPAAPGSAAPSAPLASPPAFSSPMAQALATALSRSVSESGLFYESHLSQLAFGQRRLETLAREPQAMLSHQLALREGAAAPRSGRAAADTAASSAPSARTESLPLRAAEPLSASAAGTTNAGPLSAIPGIHAETAAMVRQQLEVLANASFQWQGQAWEGTPMQWEIGEHPGEADAPATWSTRLSLELPRLGTIEARLSMASNQLVLRLVADQSAAPLQASASVLRERLSGVGLTLSELAIQDAVAREPAP